MKNWLQHKKPAAEKWLNKLWYIYITENDVTLKHDGSERYVIIWQGYVIPGCDDR